MKKLQVFGVSLFVLVFLISCVSAKNISLEYPSQIKYGEIFSINLTLIDFSQDIYDIKIDITNSSGERIAKIFNGQTWQSTYNYVNDMINTSLQNSSSLLLNITEIYSNTANMEIKIRNSANNADNFAGYLLNILYQTQQNQTQNQTNQTQNSDIYLKLDYNKTIKNGEEFKIKVYAYNLEEKNYDVKVYIEDNETTLSEIYDDNEEGWKSGTYYVDSVFSGPENKSESLRLRIREKYGDFVGDVKVKAKIRISGAGDIIAEIEDDIEIEKRAAEEIMQDSESSSESSEEEEEVAERGITGSVIRLNQPKDINISNNVYKSKTQYIKEYGIYGFALLCVFVIIILLIKNRKI